MASVAQLIAQYARKHRVDPAAALSVARGEGGLKWGAVGDQGTSYGPFQLHRGGALPAGRDASWANSPAGINYALKRMAASGAAGLEGPAAVESIIRNFERPADPDASVRNALARYSTSSPATPGVSTPASVAASPIGKAAKAGDLGIDFKIPKLDLGFDDEEDDGGLFAKTEMPELPTLDPPGPRERGQVATGDAGLAPVDDVMPSDTLGARAVKMAASQLGKPYLFGSGPDVSSFDCSDLVQWSYRQLGISIPRDTGGQMKALKQKDWKDLQIGDPLYRRSGGHVVIYAGNGRVIAAPHTGTVVQYQPLTNFPQDSYVPYQIPRPR